jgi:hypothetical protein
MNRIRHIMIGLLLTAQTFAQPGPDVIFPIDINLNEYPNFLSGEGQNAFGRDFRPRELGIIRIDSTSDLSLIPLLKEEENLSLDIMLPFIPEGFEDFEQTQYLRLFLNSPLVDISFVNAFPQLKILHVTTLGDLSFSDFLKLDSIRTLDISFSRELKNLNAFSQLNSLQEISLRHVDNLRSFPEFDTSNQIKKVMIYQESGDGCTNCLPNPNVMDISALNKLRQLQELNLSNVNGLTTIPGDLSRELRVFTIFDVRRSNQEYAIRSYLQDVSNFSEYKKLEVIELAGVHLAAFAGDFTGLNLKRLSLRWVYGLNDISGLFTMNSIENVWIQQCGLQVIEGNACVTKMNRMTFSDCNRIENIDFLLGCENIAYLELGASSKLRVPPLATWKIPNLTVYAGNGTDKFYVIKKDGVVQETAHLEGYLRQ